MAQQLNDAVRDQVKSIVSRLDGTILEQPIASVNKTFLASLGLADQFRSGFETKFNELVEDGEKARDRAQKSAAEWREQASSNARTAQKNVSKRVEFAVEKLLGYSPVATSNDVDRLNAKLDKVLAIVAK